MGYSPKRYADTVIKIVHDYTNINWPGIKKSVDEFFEDKKEYPVYMPDNGGSVLIRKL